MQSYEQTNQQPSYLCIVVDLFINIGCSWMYGRLYRKNVACDVCICSTFSLFTLTYNQLFIYTIHYCIKLYTNIHKFIYTIHSLHIHIDCTTQSQYIKELHNNNRFKHIKKVLNNRICYWNYIMNLHYYLNSLNI